MGFGAFNARRSAKNFTDEEFASAVRYCHLRGVRVYLTLNTAERRLLIQGLLSFRNKVITKGIDTVDIDRVLMRIMK